MFAFIRSSFRIARKLSESEVQTAAVETLHRMAYLESKILDNSSRRLSTGSNGWSVRLLQWTLLEVVQPTARDTAVSNCQLQMPPVCQMILKWYSCSLESDIK